MGQGRLRRSVSQTQKLVSGINVYLFLHPWKCCLFSCQRRHHCYNSSPRKIEHGDLCFKRILLLTDLVFRCHSALTITSVAADDLRATNAIKFESSFLGWGVMHQPEKGQGIGAFLSLIIAMYLVFRLWKMQSGGRKRGKTASCLR